MRGLASEELMDGACYDLAPQVLDKYFHSQSRASFEQLTAKAICASCDIQVSCLEDAIAFPIGDGIRGGETAESVRALNYQHRRERTPVSVLADIALRHQVPLQGRPYGRPALLKGDFKSPELAFPELGGEA